MKYRACLILSECYSLDLLLWIGVQLRNQRFLAYLALPDRRCFCNLSEISRTIWLLYCDQLYCNLSYSKCFWLLQRHYGPVWTCKAYVSELDYVVCSSVQLSNHTPSEAMHNVSVHQLSWYYQSNCVAFAASTVLVPRYSFRKLACTEILQNFWFTRGIIRKIVELQ